jgi:hypothetical protein
VGRTSPSPPTTSSPPCCAPGDPDPSGQAGSPARSVSPPTA